MPKVSRSAGSKSRSKSGGRPASAKTMVREAADLLISSYLLPSGTRNGAAHALEVMIKGIETSLRTAKSVRVEVTFTPRGEILVGNLSLPNVRRLKKFTRAKDDETVLAAAIKRGEAMVATILSRPEMLTGERFAELVGVSRMAVHKKLKKHQILGLEGAKRGLRYPAWQLADDGRPVVGLSELLPKFAGTPWTAYRFLLQRHAGLGKKTAIDALKAGRQRAVLEVADTVLSGDFS